LRKEAGKLGAIPEGAVPPVSLLITGRMIMTPVRRQVQLFWLVLAASLAFSPAGAAVSVPAAPSFVVPYTSYTYDYWGQAVAAPQAYLPVRTVRGEDLGVGPFSNPRDLYVSPNGRIYIADTGNHRVIVLDSDWSLLRVISRFENGGVEDRLSSPNGVFVTATEELYVADTGNGRIVHFDSEGRLLRTIGPPESDVEGVLPAGFVYRPLKIGVDLHGRIYVISQDVFEGLITFSEDGQFRGFVGAPRVTPNLIDYIWSRIATREQRAQMQLFLPTEYSNLDIDPDGFIYATVVDRDENGADGLRADRLRRLNYKGEDLLRRIGFYPPVGDVQFPNRWSTATRRSSSILIDVSVNELGTYSVLDNNRGRVFTYDNNGNLLFVFGYRGQDKGQAMNPVALDRLGLQMLVLDAGLGSVVVFEPTEYALLILAAMDSYQRGRYAEAEAIWREVLEHNANYDLAYTGIGRSLLRRGEYAEAMWYFRLGNNRRDYSEAFSLYRRGIIYQNFGKFGFAGVFVVAAAAGARSWLRRRERRSAWREVAAAQLRQSGPGRRFLELLSALRFSLRAIVHPFEGFYELKKGVPGSLGAAWIILALVVANAVASTQYTGFIFNTTDLTRVNLLMEILSVLIPFFLWTGVNWALTTLMDGKGTMRQIFVATSYALLPLVLFGAPSIVLSNYITAEEEAFLRFFQILGTLWTGVLIVIGGVMTTHEYEFPKAVATCLLTVVGMGFVLFLAFLGINLSEQVYLFVQGVVGELLYRT